MKITKQQLKKIIRESCRRAERDRLNEALAPVRVGTPVGRMAAGADVISDVV